MSANKPSQWLAKALKVSVILNVLLMSCCVYLLARGKPFVYRAPPSPVASETEHWQSNLEVLQAFRQMSFDQLVAELLDTQFVEDGFTRRDLALACLVSVYHFDIAKALGEMPEQERQLIVMTREGERIGDIIAFPGLKEEQFKAVIQYAKVERWPVTDEGLFIIIQRQGLADADLSVVHAFSFTPEFLTVEALFKRTGLAVDRRLLLEIVMAGDWKLLEGFSQETAERQDFSQARRRQFLFNYISRGSLLSARMLLATDMAYAVKRLDDDHVIALLNMFREDNPQARQFATELLTSPRSDAVWEKAAASLYRYEGEPMPTPYNHLGALNRFVPQELLTQKIATESSPAATSERPRQDPVAIEAVPPPPRPVKAPAPQRPAPAVSKRHTVVDGDTLWRLARQYGVSMQKIKDLNQLTSDQLKPGRVLLIPAKS